MVPRRSEYSFDEAIKYYKMVIEHQLNSENKEIFANSYKHLGRIVPDVEEGVELYKKAHELGHPTVSITWESITMKANIEMKNK